MRIISSELIENTVYELFLQANKTLPSDVETCMRAYADAESNSRARSIMGKLIDNLGAARDMDIPICQDTGMAVVFVWIGNQVVVSGDLLSDAVNKGVRRAYTDGYFRKSVVADPIARVNTEDNTPAVIHTHIVKGDGVRIVCCPKGFGSENMSAIRMFNPSATREDIIDFVVQAVRNAGSNPCPPIVIGVGIGGTFEYCAYMSKLALTRKINENNSDEYYAQLEKDILEKVNNTGVGPQGFGGDTTAIGVRVEHFATHIAGLPVAVNISCHVTRHTERIL